MRLRAVSPCWRESEDLSALFGPLLFKRATPLVSVHESFWRKKTKMRITCSTAAVSRSAVVCTVCTHVSFKKNSHFTYPSNLHWGEKRKWLFTSDMQHSPGGSHANDVTLWNTWRNLKSCAPGSALSSLRLACWWAQNHRMIKVRCLAMNTVSLDLRI